MTSSIATSSSMPGLPTRLSTDAFPEAMRLSAWREIYGRNVAQFEIEPLDDLPFHADVTFHRLDDIGFAIGSRSDANYLMTPALAARARDNVIFGAVIQGTGFIRNSTARRRSRPAAPCCCPATIPRRSRCATTAAA